MAGPRLPGWTRTASTMLAAWMLVGAGCSQDPDRGLEKADALVFQRSYEDAARTYERVLSELGKDDPRGPEIRLQAYERLAHLRHHFLQDTDGALRAYRALIDLGPEPSIAAQAHLSMARLLRDRAEDPAEALDELLSALVILEKQRLRSADPTLRLPALPALRMEAARLAFQLERFGLVTEQLEALLGSGPDIKPELHREARLLLATVNAIESRPAEALELFLTLRAEPLELETQARVQFEIARCLERLGRLEEAVVAYQEAQSEAADPAMAAARATRIRARLAAQQGAIARGQRLNAPTSIRP